MATSTAVLPDVDRSLVDNFERHVARVPDRVAVGDATRTLTYAELDREANRIAGALLAVSPERGETVELGGDSLLASRILGRIAERYRVEPTLARLFEARTVAELAVEVLQAQAAQLGPAALERALADIARRPDAARS